MRSSRGRGSKKVARRRRYSATSKVAEIPPAENPLVLTLYLKEPGRPQRRPGSAAAIAELTIRVSREELIKRRKRVLKGPIAKIRRYFQQRGMTISATDPGRRRLRLRATPAQIEKAFAMRFRRTEHGGHHYRHPARTPRVPRGIAKLVRTVTGFDERPVIGRLRDMAGPQGVSGLYPSAMAGLYGITTARRGAGQCIALIEPKGGYDPEDLKKACAAMNIAVPTVVDVPVGKGHNAFGADAEADREVSLDVQVLAGVAPEARLAVYFTENSEDGLADGVTAALHDGVNKPSVIVITWGEPEATWTPQARAALDLALEDAVSREVTVVAAAGDDLATDGMNNDMKAHVDYPASHPYVLGCGGTQITLDASSTTILDEVVWHNLTRGTGGGISDLYAVPAFQTAAGLPPSVNGGRKGRGVPDVAGAASETNGYRIQLHGSEIVTGGTSATAPLWGAFIALLNAERGQSVGFINPTLYQQPQATLFRPIVSGDNIFQGIGYDAGPGWNACAGLGAPKGAAIIAALAAV